MVLMGSTWAWTPAVSRATMTRTPRRQERPLPIAAADRPQERFERGSEASNCRT